MLPNIWLESCWIPKNRVSFLPLQLDWSPSDKDLEQCSMKGKNIVSSLFKIQSSDHNDDINELRKTHKPHEPALRVRAERHRYMCLRQILMSYSKIMPLRALLFSWLTCQCVCIRPTVQTSSVCCSSWTPPTSTPVERLPLVRAAPMWYVLRCERVEPCCFTKPWGHVELIAANELVPSVFKQSFAFFVWLLFLFRIKNSESLTMSMKPDEGRGRCPYDPYQRNTAIIVGKQFLQLSSLCTCRQ